MKAISLWQPWASLIMTGAKKIETRGWPTKYRGPLVICAAKGGLSKGELIHQLCFWHFQGGLAPLVGLPLNLTGTSWPGVKAEHLPFGAALGTVDLVDCIPTDKLTLGQIGTDSPFGDFSLGRFGWILENVRPFDKPMPVVGRQGLFNFDVE
ncbi:MAG TPA: 2-oxoglutarate dehydrogenase E1 [Geobacter sp.]|nr:2-oxoglutarate dehydrogenase E1 [Geobacter sp.]